jgi:hypothetical protein
MIPVVTGIKKRYRELSTRFGTKKRGDANADISMIRKMGVYSIKLL